MTALIVVESPKPMRQSKASVKRVVDAFRQSGHSTHTEMASTLQPLLDFARTEGWPVRLTIDPIHGGFYLERIGMSIEDCQKRGDAKTKFIDMVRELGERTAVKGDMPHTHIHNYVSGLIKLHDLGKLP